MLLEDIDITRAHNNGCNYVKFEAGQDLLSAKNSNTYAQLWADISKHMTKCSIFSMIQ